MDLERVALENIGEKLRGNPYPGRGLIVGREAEGENLVQVYWIMGRSDNSRNRVFVAEGDTVRTAPADPARCQDPSLIIYNALRVEGSHYIVTNGDQTDTIADFLKRGRSCVEALATRREEPDAPNFTPRISGLLSRDGGRATATLSYLRRARAGDGTDRLFFQYDLLPPGIGFCLTTYQGDGEPLPAFAGEPYLVPLAGPVERIADYYWRSLNTDNRISLAARLIGLDGGQTTTIINKYEAAG